MANARLHVDIYVECPHCKEDCSLMDDPYDYEDFIRDAFNPEKWDKINWEIGCSHCGGDFNVNKIEW